MTLTYQEDVSRWHRPHIVEITSAAEGCGSWLWRSLVKAAA
jgi:hypothetical protein